MKIPLYTPTDVPNAWHQAIAPGGYEWWRFEAEDAAGQLRVVVDFFQGLVFDPAYLRAYRRYRRWPTRCVPPLPAGFPGVSLALYRGSQTVAQVTQQYSTGQFTAGTDRLDIQIGPNSVRMDHDGSLQIAMNLPACAATFRFLPKAPPGRPLEPRWDIALPACDVSGEVMLNQRFTFTGFGYHDHRFGTEPLGIGLKQWMSARVLMDNHSVIFQHSQPATGTARIHLVEADGMGIREIAVDRQQADWNRRTRMLLRYPGTIQIGPLELRAPHVLWSSLSHARLMYDASVRGVRARALMDIVYPNRLMFQ